MAKLPTVEQMKFRRYPPLRSGPPILWTAGRYFRRNEGSTDYATIPEVTLTGDFVIEFEFSTTNTTTFGRILTSGDTTSNYLQVILNGSAGSLLFELSNGTSKVFIPTGLNVNDGALHSGRVRFSSLDSTYYASVDGGAEVGQSLVGVVNKVSTIYKSDSAGGVLQGILANLKIYDNGTLIRDYPINDNSSTIRDLANGQDGTIINGNADDWGLFDKTATGWSGQELWVFGDAVSNGVEGGFGTFNVTGVLFPLYQSDSTIEWSFDAIGMSEGSAYLWGLSPLIASNGNYYGTGVPSSPGIRGRVGGSQCNAGTTFSNISVKEVLKNA